MVPYFLIDHQYRLDNIMMSDITSLPFTIGFLCSCQYEPFLTTFSKISLHNVLKICDSGAFSKHGHNSNTYDKLLPMYERLNIHYGVMLDFRNDRLKTTDSAREGFKKHKDGNYSYELLGVCQGKWNIHYNPNDWIECYRDLYSIGYDYFAIGGTIIKNDFNMYYRIDEYLTKKIIQGIRDINKNARIFALGFLSPSRVNYMIDNNVDGDSKSWIFDFTTRGKGTKPMKDIERADNLNKKYFKPMMEYYNHVN